MSRRKRLTRAFAIAALGLGIAAPVAQARPIDVKGHGWTSAAAVTVAATQHASPQSSLPPNLRAAYQRNNDLASSGFASTGLVGQSAKQSVNWTAVSLATGISILVIGAFGITAYRVRIRRPAPVA